MWMKVIAVILFGTLGLAFVCDLIVIDEVYSKAGRAVEHSIDAGIIHSGIVEDAQQGIVRLNEPDLRDATQTAFRRNMNLDSQLQNKIIKNGRFNLKLDYIDSVPWIQVEFKTDVSFSLPFIKYPITITRKVPYESIYK